MRAMAVQHADAAGLVAEGDEVLAQDAYRKRQVAKLRRQADRLPGGADILAEGRSRPHGRQLAVGAGDFALMVAGIFRRLRGGQCFRHSGILSMQ